MGARHDRYATTTPSSRRGLRRAITDWLTEGRIERLEEHMTASADAYAELDAQLDALEEYVVRDDETDAEQVRARASRIRSLLDAVNPATPTPAPGEPGAVEPVPADQVSPDVPVEG